MEHDIETRGLVGCIGLLGNHKRPATEGEILAHRDPFLHSRLATSKWFRAVG